MAWYFCAWYVHDAAKVCAKLQKHCTFEVHVMGEQNVARFEFEMSFRLIPYIATEPSWHHTYAYNYIYPNSSAAPDDLY